MQTRRYTIVKIPHPVQKPAKKKQQSFADLEGILKDVPAFKGKSSVEVQHMIKDLWTDQHRKLTPFS